MLSIEINYLGLRVRSHFGDDNTVESLKHFSTDYSTEYKIRGGGVIKIRGPNLFWAAQGFTFLPLFNGNFGVR